MKFPKMKYEYLNRIRVTLHEQHQKQLSTETLNEIKEYTDFEFYSQKEIKSISNNGLIQAELNKLIKRLLDIRKLQPEGSNQECMCMDQINEFIGKLDMLDFRKIKIENLII